MTTAVLAVHYQNDIVHPDGRLAIGPDVVDMAESLLAGARARGWTVVSVGVVLPEAGVCNSPMFRRAAERAALRPGSWGAGFHERLAPHEGEPIVMHSRINAFYDSELADVVAELGAGQLVVGGVATHSSVEHTARHAADAGYEVVVAADACTAGDRQLHEASLRAVALHVERVSSVEEILG